MKSGAKRGQGDVPKWLRERSAKPPFIGSNPIVASSWNGLIHGGQTKRSGMAQCSGTLFAAAGVAELVDAQDLKS